MDVLDIQDKLADTKMALARAKRLCRDRPSDRSAQINMRSLLKRRRSLERSLVVWGLSQGLVDWV